MASKGARATALRTARTTVSVAARVMLSPSMRTTAVAYLLAVATGRFRADMKDLSELKQPAIVPIEYAGFKHFVVFRGLRDGRVFLADPSAGHIVFSQEEFAKLWDRNTLFLLYPPKSKPTTLALLSLSDRELGVIDGDLVRPEAVLPQLDRTEALQRAVQSGLGIFTLRKQ